jgi:hypothetical protein
MVMVKMTFWIAFILAAEAIATVYALPLALPARMSVFIFNILYCYLKSDKPSTKNTEGPRPPNVNERKNSKSETKSIPETESTVPKVEVPSIVISAPIR